MLYYFRNEVMQTFVVVTFNINVFRPQLRDQDMIPRILEAPCGIRAPSLRSAGISRFVKGGCSGNRV